jgi:5-hydroxyisourate hydrolase
MAKLSTHVLDTYSGKPARDMTIELWRLDESQRRHLKTMRTNADGRGDAPLLEGDSLVAGEYELVFFVRHYFVALLGNREASPFLNQVVVRFTIFDAEQNYHVPLLVSPWAYSTYRGS